MNKHWVTAFVVCFVMSCIIGFSTSPSRAEDTLESNAAVQSLLGEIRLRQLDLDRRERALIERERAQLEIEKAIESQIQEVVDQRRTMERRMESWESKRGERVRQLAKIYAAMKAPKAARLLEGLEENLATQILSKMKPKQSAAILEKIETDRALAVSRKVAHPLSFEPADLSQGDS